MGGIRNVRTEPGFGAEPGFSWALREPDRISNADGRTFRQSYYDP